MSKRSYWESNWIVPSRWSWITEPPLVGQASLWVCMMNLAIWNEVCRSNRGSAIQWERVGKYQPYPVRTFISLTTKLIKKENVSLFLDLPFLQENMESLIPKSKASKPLTIWLRHKLHRTISLKLPSSFNYSDTKQITYVMQAYIMHNSTKKRQIFEIIDDSAAAMGKV